MAGTAQISWIIFLFLCRQAITQITGPPRSLTHFVGENAHFRWTSDDNSILFSATWGIRKGSIADPKFIHVNILSNKTNINSDLKPDLISRLSFDGDLRKGHAWFVLKNVTLNDTNEYLASISDDVTRSLPYTVVLTVKGKETDENKSEKTTKQPKQPKSQTVPSKLPPRVETSTKEAETETKLTESHASEGRPDKSLTNSKDGLLPWIIIIIVIIPISIIAFICYKRYRVPRGPNAASGEREKGHHQERPLVLIEGNKQGAENHNEELVYLLEEGNNQEYMNPDLKNHNEESAIPLEEGNNQEDMNPDTKNHDEESAIPLEEGNNQVDMNPDPKNHNEESAIPLEEGNDQEDMNPDTKNYDEESAILLEEGNDQDDMNPDPKNHNEESAIPLEEGKNQDDMNPDTKNHDEESAIPLQEGNNQEDMNPDTKTGQSKPRFSFVFSEGSIEFLENKMTTGEAQLRQRLDLLKILQEVSDFRPHDKGIRRRRNRTN